jgi:hypothetical protein
MSISGCRSASRTDTRFWRVKGVPAFVYGCSPAGMGGLDESVSIAEFHHVLRVHALAATDYLPVDDPSRPRIGTSLKHVPIKCHRTRRT